MYEHYVEEGLFDHAYRFDPETWTIPRAMQIEPATINFPTRSSVYTASMDPFEQRWIDDVVSAYNDTAGRLVYDPALVYNAGRWVYDPATGLTGSHLVYSNNSISWTAQPLIWSEDEKDDLAEDVDMSAFI